MSIRLLTEMFRVKTEAEKASTRGPTGPRVDAHAPLNIRIGSFVTINPTSAILAQSQGHRLKDAVEGEFEVVAYGAARIAEFAIHRFYLAQRGAPTPYVIQVATNPKGEVEGITLMRTFTDSELPLGSQPHTDDEWNNWIPMRAKKRKGETFLIGFESFQMPGEDIQYGRAWDTSGGPVVDPVVINESLSEGPYGPNKKLERKAMLYGRNLPPSTGGTDETAEWLFVSAVTKRDQGGRALEAWIEIAAGLDLEPSDLTILTASDKAA